MSTMPGPPDPDRDRLGELLRAVEAPAPAALHERVAELIAAGSKRRPHHRRASVLAPAAGFIVAVVALVIALGTGTITAPPTPQRVSQLALAAANAPAPATLIAAGTTISFPHWSHWPAAGMRRDRIGGRTITTEFYSSYRSGRIGYAIVSGAPVGLPSGGYGVNRVRERFWVSGGEAGAHVVSWVQDGHSCVLASRSVAAATLLALAISQYSGAPV